jgi:hypothetical protein
MADTETSTEQPKRYLRDIAAPEVLKAVDDALEALLAPRPHER